MSHDKIDSDYILLAKKFKSIVCRAECIHKDAEKPLCAHEWVELDEPGQCIFYTPLARMEVKP